MRGLAQSEGPRRGLRPAANRRSLWLGQRLFNRGRGKGQVTHALGRRIEDAVRDLCCAFRAGKFENSMTNDSYVNVKAVKKLGLQ